MLICMVKMKQSKRGGTHGSPGPRPPLVLCRGHVPAVLSGVVGQVGLVVGPVVGGLAGGGRTLLLSAGTLVWVTERLVQLMMVAHAHEPARGATHATRHRALEQKHTPQSAHNQPGPPLQAPQLKMSKTWPQRCTAITFYS